MAFRQHIKEHTQFGHSGASYSASKGINDYKEVGHSCHSRGKNGYWGDDVSEVAQLKDSAMLSQQFDS